MRIAMLVSALVLVPLAAGCGAEADPVPPGDDEPPAPQTSLEILVWPEGEGASEPERYTLACDPPSGDHPDPVAACSALAELGAEAFAPVPADAMCTQQYGGPMEAHVRGTVGGEPVDARFAYTDGCQIARWDQVEVVVPRLAA